MKKSIILFLIIVCLLTVPVFGYAKEAPHHVLIATSGSASSYYLCSQAMWKVINKYSSDVVVGTLVETGGSYDECNRVGVMKVADIGEQTAMGAIQELYVGAGPFKKAHPELRMLFADVMGLYPFCVRVAANINKIEDLDGRLYNPGPPGSGEEVLTRSALKALGIKPKYRPSSVGDAVRAMKNRQIVGYTKFCAPDSLDASMMDIATAQKITWIGFTKEQTKKISMINPLFYWYKVEKGTVKRLPEVSGWFIATVLTGFTTTKLPQIVAYRIVRDIFEHMNEVLVAYPKWGIGIGTNVKDQIKFFSEVKGMPPMHAGVIQYWEELGFKVPSKLIPPEYQRK